MPARLSSVLACRWHCQCVQEELLAELLADDEVAQKGQGSSKKGKRKKAKQTKGKQAGSAAKNAAGGGNAPGTRHKQCVEQQETQEAMPSSDVNEQTVSSPVAQQRSAEPASFNAPLPAELATAEDQGDGDGGRRPPSPDWQVVGRVQRHQALHHLHQHSDGGSSGGSMRRCPSASSLGSTCR